MPLEASDFIQNRESPYVLTEQRIKKILCFTIDCYLKIIREQTVFDYSNKGTNKKEDYLRSRLVDDYMQPNIFKLNEGTPHFSIANKEATEEYIGARDKMLHPDPIDIQVVDTGLQNSWGSKGKTYFVFECKRITKLSDISYYIHDIGKFTERDYTKIRLPFEGQMAFVENNSLTSRKFTDNVNAKLKKHKSIVTKQHLLFENLHPRFKESYRSVHRKSFHPFECFLIFHLFFDFSNNFLN